ncbi:MAG: GNAT family N-acetyltransferase [Paludibacter sp.]
MIDNKNPEFHDLINKQGTYYHGYYDTWMNLPKEDKQLCTHPIYMIDYINAFSAINSFSFVLVLFNNQCISILPVKLVYMFGKKYKLYYVEIPVICTGSSIAIPKELTTDVFRKLFQYKFDKFSKPLFFNFRMIDENNNFLKICFPKIIIEWPYTRKVLDISGESSLSFGHLNKLIKNLKKAEKNLCTNNDLNLSIIHDRDELHKSFDELVELEYKGWKKDANASLKFNNVSRGFYSLLLDDLSIDRNAIIAKLTLSDRTIAMAFCIIVDDTMYGNAITYDEEYSKFSPGHLLLYKMLKDYFPARNLCYLNTLSEAKWFQLWKPLNIKVFNVYVIRNSFMKLVLQTGIAVFSRIKFSPIKKERGYISHYTSRKEARLTDKL